MLHYVGSARNVLDVFETTDDGQSRPVRVIELVLIGTEKQYHYDATGLNKSFRTETLRIALGADGIDSLIEYLQKCKERDFEAVQSKEETVAAD